MAYQTLLFDADDTLLDFHKTEAAALASAFAASCIPLTPEVKSLYNQINQDLWKRFERGEIDRNTVVYTRFQKLFDALGIRADGRAFEDNYQARLGEGAFLIDGAFDLYSRLSQTYDLYIVTNGVSKTQRSRLSASGLLPYTKGVFISEDAGCQKPMKEYFDYVFSRIPGIDVSRTLIVGDSLTSDIRGGNNAGIDTCWYNPKGLPNSAGCTVTYEIRQLSELYQYL